MVLRALGVPSSECSLKQLRTLNPEGTSIWTVDLAYALHAYGARFQYLTATIGVDPAYKAEPFYKPTLDADALRVNELFDRAESERISIECKSVEDDELADLLRPQTQLVMALVDRRYLYRPGLSNIMGSSNPGSQLVTGLVETCLSYYFSGYVGHYVLLIKYDEARDGFVLHDPARAPEPIFVPSRDLHAARRCHGTDEDLVVIPYAQPGLRMSLRESGTGRPAPSPLVSKGSKDVSAAA